MSSAPEQGKENAISILIPGPGAHGGSGTGWSVLEEGISDHCRRTVAFPMLRKVMEGRVGIRRGDVGAVASGVVSEAQVIVVSCWPSICVEAESRAALNLRGSIIDALPLSGWGQRTG